MKLTKISNVVLFARHYINRRAMSLLTLLNKASQATVFLAQVFFRGTSALSGTPSIAFLFTLFSPEGGQVPVIGSHWPKANETLLRYFRVDSPLKGKVNSAKGGIRTALGTADIDCRFLVALCNKNFKFTN